MGFLTSSAVLLLLALEISATVHRFPAKHRSRSREHVEMIKAMRDGPKQSLELLEDTGRFPMTFGYDVFAADISIGTPPQRLTVDINPYYDGHLGVIGSKADLSYVTTTVPKKVYNSSASSTYTSAKGNFKEVGGMGHWGNDVVNLGGLNVNLKFGIDDQLNSWYDQEPIDGTLGLSPRGDRSDPQNSVLQQLLNSTSKVDQHLLTIWTNLTRKWNDSAQITLGSDDPEHCQSDSWAFGTEVNSNYIVNVTTATAKANGSDLAVDLGTRPLNLLYASHLHVPEILASYYDTCYLNMYYFDDHSGDNVIYFPYQFQRNHCIAYNFQKKTIGVGMSKWQLQSPKDF